MEFPFGHHGHHHGHRRDDGDEERHRYPPPGHHDEFGRPHPPPPQFGDNPYGPSSYPSVQHVSHEVRPGENPYGYGPPPVYPTVQHVSHEVGPGENPYGYGPPPDYPTVQHVSHEVGPGFHHPPRPQHGENFYTPPPPDYLGRGYDPQPPAFPATGVYGQLDDPQHRHHRGNAAAVEHVSHVSGESGAALNRQPTVRVFTKAREDYSLSVRDGKVILAPADPRDEYQHWIKDLKYSTRVKDEEGLPSFALVNKVTGQAIKHSIGATHQVRLVPYNPDYLDESVLWTESYDTGENFRCIRMVNNIRLNFDAFNGDEDHGGVRNGTPVVLWEWLKGKNQRWKIVPY